MRVQPATLGVSMGVVALVAAVVSPRGTTPEPKIPLCHATASLEHPYNLEDVDGDAIVLPDGEPTAHGTHTGPVYPAAGWGDIIPPFPYANASGGTSIFPGLNWTQYGEAVWNAGCDVTLVEPGPEEPSTTLPVPTTTVPKESTTTTEPSTTTTTSPTTTTSEQTTTTLGTSTTTSSSSTTTTTPSSSTTTTTASSSTTTTTTSPSTTTTTPRPPSTPTTAPPSEIPPTPTDPPNGVEITPPVNGEAVDPNDHVVDLGPLSPEERVGLEAELDGSLAYTGQNLAVLAAVALAAILGGSTLLLATRTRRRTRWMRWRR